MATTTSWQDLDAGRELDRVVAEAQGYRFEYLHEDHNGKKWFAVWNSDGKPVNRFTVASYSGNEWPEHELKNAYPEFSTNERDAFTLDLSERGWMLELKQAVIPGGVEWTAIYYHNGHARGVGAFGATPALAICRARLNWQETEGNHGD